MTDGAEPALGPKPNSLRLDIGCANTEVSVGGMVKCGSGLKFLEV